MARRYFNPRRNRFNFRPWEQDLIVLALFILLLLAASGERAAGGKPLRVCVAAAPEAHGSHPFQLEVRFSGIVPPLWPAGSYDVSTGRLIEARRSEADPLLWLVRIEPAWSADMVFRLFPEESGVCGEKSICDVSGRPLSNLLKVQLAARPWYRGRLVQPACR